MTPKPSCRVCGSTTRKLRYIGPRAGSECTPCTRDAKLAQKAAAHAVRVAGEYGLDLGTYDALSAAQAGCCAICGRGQDGWIGSGRRKHRLPVDHSHKTGRVRGLLCSPCNDFIAYINDDPEAAKRMFKYLGGDGHLNTAEMLQIVAISLR